MKDLKVLAGIVTFNPDEKRLYENLDSLIRQVSDILIVDNGSKNAKIFFDQLPPNLKKHITILYLKENRGIAKALSEIMLYARDKKFDWVLTLDQDSILKPGIVLQYKKSALLEINTKVGMFTCLIRDRNYTDKKYEYQKKDYMDVNYCITSGAFTNVAKYFKTTGYDVAFFIDCVDFDICYLLREKGYIIRRLNFTGLYHEVGHGENRNFLGKRIVVYHQKPIRIYYLTRNTIWMHKKHRGNYSSALMVKKLLALLIKILLYEDRKKEKICNYMKGLKDSRKYEVENL